jgi:hypothetical protein
LNYDTRCLKRVDTFRGVRRINDVFGEADTEVLVMETDPLVPALFQYYLRFDIAQLDSLVQRATRSPETARGLPLADTRDR